MATIRSVLYKLGDGEGKIHMYLDVKQQNSLQHLRSSYYLGVLFLQQRFRIVVRYILSYFHKLNKISPVIAESGYLKY